MEICEGASDNRFTQAFGFPSERAVTKVKDFLTEPVRAFIAESTVSGHGNEQSRRAL